MKNHSKWAYCRIKDDQYYRSIDVSMSPNLQPDHFHNIKNYIHSNLPLLSLQSKPVFASLKNEYIIYCVDLNYSNHLDFCIIKLKHFQHPQRFRTQRFKLYKLVFSILLTTKNININNETKFLCISFL